ncbi:MAG: zf-HC2 domain-containing protein [Chromatiales bacterium]|nr:MAG: zf-HC2 domain-containing protein [Chromatiales bacterium]
MNRLVDHAEHDDITMLLPWYANGTLNEADRQRVDQHLATCGQCSDELSLCYEMQNATLADGAIPIPPAASASAIIGRRDWRSRFGFLGDRRTQRIAAVLAAVGLLFVLGMMQLSPTELPNQRFTATTSAGASDSMDYVLELRFSSGVSQAARSKILQELGGTAQPVGEADDVYAVLMNLPPQSLSDLDQLARDFAARDEIETAQFVALQVPVR